MSVLRAGVLAAGLALAACAHAQQGPFAGPPEWLQELDLSETQQEGVFRIFYEQAPAVRERIQAARHAHEELEKMALAAQLDTDAARSLADGEDQALYEVSQMRIEALRRVLKLLTEAQQARVVKLRLPD